MSADTCGTAAAAVILLGLLYGLSGSEKPCLRPVRLATEAHGAFVKPPTDGVAAGCPGAGCACPGAGCVLSEAALGLQPAAAAPPPSPRPPDGVALHGHEWMGGVTGYAERPGGASAGWGSAQHQPPNATLLLLGVVSGAKNFDNRNWVRRAFWRQRAWRLGVNFRFVVGGILPKGDNDRVSLYYEKARWGDVDIVARGYETPPRQARTTLRWWQQCAALAAEADAPQFFGLTSDAVLVSLPRIVLRLRSLLATRHQHGVPASQRYVYGGDLRWAAWADGDGKPAPAGAAWKCVAATTARSILEGRLAGEGAPEEPGVALTAAARKRASEPGSSLLGLRASPCVGSPPGGFLAAGPQLQLLSAPLLLRLKPMLGRRLAVHRLEVTPPHELWDRSTQFHQSPAGRTPSQPALLAATALGRAVHNASRTRPVAFAHLRTSHGSPAFSWEAEPKAVPGPQALLARGVDSGIAAEAVAERFERMRARNTPQPRVRCARSRCASWGVPPERDAVCCEEEGSA